MSSRAASASVASSKCLGAPVGGCFQLGFGGGFLIEESLPVGDRDLIVIRMDFVEGEKTVTVAAVVDECGL